VYRGVEAFLAEWYQSVLEQTDQDFQLWIASDHLTVEAVTQAIGRAPEARWIFAQPGDTPSQIRQQVLLRAIETSNCIVLVDSDDVLHESRVVAAREAIETADLSGCALRLVDAEGQDLGLTLGSSADIDADVFLPRHNIFGFSNTTYRSKLLQSCLPIPADVVLVDWFLATKAWLMGARLTFDPIVRMDYRQHGANMAPIRYPWDADQVVRDTKRVMKHFDLLLASPIENLIPDRWAMVQEVAADVQLFSERVLTRPDNLERYVRSLNGIEPRIVWWWDVAQPALQWMWKDNGGLRYEASKN
jgi:hypothetical protein